MSTVLINLSKLETAAEAATKAADNMEEYAALIPGKITSPLESLTGGSSSNTSSVVSLAQEKASELKRRATAYDTLSTQVSSFVSSAREADARVVSRISAVTESYVDDMNWWEKICYNVEKLKNFVFNLSELGKFMGNLANMLDVVDDWIENKKKKLYDWFKRGDGKYIASAVLSGLAAAAAIALAITSFPVSGILATIAAGAAVISAVVATIDFAFTFMDSIKAIIGNDTEPGVADYYGSTSSVSDWFKKHTTSKTAQTIASVTDIVGKIAGVVASIGSVFTKTAADGTKLGTLDKSTIKENILGKLGLEFDSTTGKYSMKTSILGWSSKHTEGAKEYATWFYNAESVKNYSSVIKNIISTMDSCSTVTGYSYSGLDSLSDVGDLGNNILDIIGQFVPTVSSVKKAMTSSVEQRQSLVEETIGTFALDS